MTTGPIIDQEKAYLLWLENYRHKDADAQILPFLTLAKKSGWLKCVREALLLSTNQVAQKIGVSKTTYIRFEKAEAAGTITFSSFKKAAGALNCEIIYALRPKKKTTFSRLVWENLQPEAIDHPWVKSRPPERKALALAAAAKRRMQEPRVRRSLAWTERKNKGRA